MVYLKDFCERHQNLQSVFAFTEADLGAVYNNANSPKNYFSVRFLMLIPLIYTVTSPSIIIKNKLAISPCLKIQSFYFAP